MIPLCRYLGVGVIPWSPLTRGLLAGTRHRNQPPATTRAASDTYAHQLYTTDDHDTVDALRTLAQARNLPPAQLALAWLLAKPGITAPIIGATQPGHIDNAIAAMQVHLDGGETTQLEAAYRPHPVRGHS